MLINLHETYSNSTCSTAERAGETILTLYLQILLETYAIPGVHLCRNESTRRVDAARSDCDWPVLYQRSVPPTVLELPVFLKLTTR